MKTHESDPIIEEKKRKCVLMDHKAMKQIVFSKKVSQQS